MRWGDTAKIGTAPDQLFWTEEASSKLFWSQFFWTCLSLRIHCVANVGDRYWQGEREGTEKGSFWRGIRGEPE